LKSNLKNDNFIQRIFALKKEVIVLKNKRSCVKKNEQEKKKLGVYPKCNFLKAIQSKETTSMEIYFLCVTARQQTSSKFASFFFLLAYV